MAKLLVTVPNQGWIRKELAARLISLFSDTRHELHLWFPEYVPLENGLQHVWNRLRESDFDWWLNLDDDTVPLKNPLDLVDLDLDLIGFPYPILRDLEGQRTLHWSAYIYDPGELGYYPAQPKKSVQEVSAVGGGAILVAKRVWMSRRLVSGVWERERAQDGTVRRGNDLSFCCRVRAAGWRIWTHWDYPCAHVKEVDLCQIIGGPVGGPHGPHREEGGVDDAAQGHQPECAPTVHGDRRDDGA